MGRVTVMYSIDYDADWNKQVFVEPDLIDNVGTDRRDRDCRYGLARRVKP